MENAATCGLVGFHVEERRQQGFFRRRIPVCPPWEARSISVVGRNRFARIRRSHGLDYPAGRRRKQTICVIRMGNMRRHSIPAWSPEALLVLPSLAS